MCYYNGIRIAYQDYIRLKNIERKLENLRLSSPVVSGFDYINCPVIKPDHKTCSWDIVQMEWGFLPSYLKDREAVKNFRQGYTDKKGKFHSPVTTLNAMGEELLLRGKMYRNAAIERRCLVISFGFYEWRHIFPLGKKGVPIKMALKYPYHIQPLKEAYWFMAGIYQPWTDKQTGETIESFAVVTTRANELMEQVHNSKKRMPVILTEGMASKWISDTLTEPEINEITSFQYPSALMHAHSIAKDFKTSLQPDEPFSYNQLPDLGIGVPELQKRLF
ncbi:hypothetical protein BH09BAC2_BH09BAC2_00070 [soil metagenome]